MLRAAQANLVTAAAERVLAACRAATDASAGVDNGENPGESPGGARSLREDVEELRRLSAAAAVAPSGGTAALGERRGASGVTLAEQVRGTEYKRGFERKRRGHLCVAVWKQLLQGGPVCPVIAEGQSAKVHLHLRSPVMP